MAGYPLQHEYEIDEEFQFWKNLKIPSSSPAYTTRQSTDRDHATCDANSLSLQANTDNVARSTITYESTENSRLSTSETMSDPNFLPSSVAPSYVCSFEDQDANPFWSPNIQYPTCTNSRSGIATSPSQAGSIAPRVAPSSTHVHALSSQANGPQAASTDIQTVSFEAKGMQPASADNPIVSHEAEDTLSASTDIQAVGFGAKGTRSAAKYFQTVRTEAEGTQSEASSGHKAWDVAITTIEDARKWSATGSRHQLDIVNDDVHVVDTAQLKLALSQRLFYAITLPSSPASAAWSGEQKKKHNSSHEKALNDCKALLDQHEGNTKGSVNAMEAIQAAIDLHTYGIPMSELQVRPVPSEQRKVDGTLRKQRDVKVVKTHKGIVVDLTSICSARVENMIEHVEKNKLVAKDVLQGDPVKVQDFARGPDAYAGRKVQNLKGNSTKEAHIKAGKKAEEAESGEKTPRGRKRKAREDDSNDNDGFDDNFDDSFADVGTRKLTKGRKR